MSDRHVVVTGSRDWTDRYILDDVLSSEPRDTIFIEGGCASGADQMTWEFCQRTDRPWITILADWRRLNKRAGPIRNGWMLQYKPRKVIAFFQRSPAKNQGTSDCCEQAEALGIHVERNYA